MNDEQVKRMARASEQQEESTPLQVLYLDLDGTVRKGFDEIGRFVNGPEDVEIFPEALAAMHEYRAAGWKIVAITNQGGIALGHLTMDKAIAALNRTYGLCDQLFDKMMMCRHHPDAKDPYMAHCWCRKPRIGAIIEAAMQLSRQFDGMCPPHLALMVGDREEDRLCAENAGIRFLWAKDWRAGAR